MPTQNPQRRRIRLPAEVHGEIGVICSTSVFGLTDAGGGQAPALPRKSVRGLTTKPICVGFGIGGPEQAALVGRLADGVIVGSAIVSLIERYAGSSELVSVVGDFIAALKAPLRGRAEG